MLNFLKKNTKKTNKVKTKLSEKIFKIISKSNQLSDEILEELESVLISADIGLSITEKLLTELKKIKTKNNEEIYENLKSLLTNLIPEYPEIEITKNKPFVILVVGVNGAGKTTSIGKIANFYKQQGKSVMLAAGDTFRAAAVEQLKTWGERNNIKVVAQQTGSDAASVAFDALQSAISKNTDVLIIDTAGRLHTQNNLMIELEKIKRVLSKNNSDYPNETLLVIDGNSGQNAIIQAQEFHKYTPLTGLVITKLDGSAKGGIVFNVINEVQVPIRFIGVGESIEDIQTFNKKDFIENLF
ncbi:Signal recognition particle receptor protein FtsY (=alpha subunit) (TC 3.A.5.1.1) [hydrothermal vent metagenome]|uniref:Signal recognition particle receptor protein FtsY (=alpha subunit) (TC 3.A.5.1.1) n=1 Tax=hydrothermal vent metagenome TaxID=652676 RepID=A0A1W1C899_9ZZZZ